MKNLTLIIALLIGLQVSAQKKGDSKALIQLESKEAAFTKAVSILAQEGFSMQVVEKDAGVISTQSKGAKRFQSKYNVFISDTGLITLTGLMTIGDITLNGITDNSWGKIENKGMKGSPIRLSWEELVNIAQQIGEQVTYE